MSDNDIHFEEEPDTKDTKTETSESNLDNTKVQEEHKDVINEEITVKEEKIPNAILSQEYSFSSTSDNNYRISLPSINIFDFTTRLNNFQKLNIESPTDDLKKWREVSEEAVEYYTVGGLYQDRFYDDNSLFKQGIESKDGELNTISSLKFKKTEGELKGEIALLKVSKMLGLGDVINVPLPHSGIWVTIKPPTEKDLIDFYNSIFREKIIFGRATYGLTLTNFSVHINHRLFDFILKHIHSVNYGDIPKDELRNYILIHDFPILAWGFACTMYPNGYDYQRACVNDIEECSYIAKAIINLTKLLWIDNKSLTEAQKIILTENRPNRLTIESYRKYITEHTRVVSSSFKTKNGITFKLKIPTFNEYTTDGLNWVNKINSAIENVILEDTSEEDAKTEMLNQYVKSSILRQFNHFIDYIEIEDNVISDRETINSVLEAFSADDDIRAEITENILKFKVNTTIALIGIPEFKCPNCGKSQNNNPLSDKFVSVIPLDTMSIVFLVLTSKISKILAREV
jgi:hypothetical protein